MNASEYLEFAEKRRSEEPLHSVTLPSGAVWKLRTPPLEQFVLAGKLPPSLTAKMMKLASRSKGSQVSVEDIGKMLTPEEIMSNLAFGRDLLLHCAVEPRISLTGEEGSIPPAKILPEDFPFLINWVMTGGAAGESLTTFRGERPVDADASFNREQVQPTAIEPDWNS